MGDNDFVSVTTSIIFMIWDGRSKLRNAPIRLCEVANKRGVPSLQTDRLHHSKMTCHVMIILTSTVLKHGNNCKDKHLVTCLMVSYNESMNDCLLSTPRMACVNFPNRFFNGSAHNFTTAFLNTPNGFSNTSNAFSNTSKGYPTGIQRFANGKVLVYVFP